MKLPIKWLLAIAILYSLPTNLTGQITIETIDSLIKKAIALEENRAPQSYRKAMAIAEEALLLIPQIKGGYKAGEGNCYLEIGLCKYYLGAYSDAIKSYEKALTIRTKLGDKMKIASVYNNMSNAYLKLYRVSDAKHCAQYSIQLYKEAKGTCGLIKVYNTYANVLAEYPNQLDSAIAYNQQALGLLFAHDSCFNTTTQLDAEYGLAKRLLKKGEDEKAKTHFIKALELARLTTDTNGIAFAFQGLGTIALKSGNLTESKRYFDEAKMLFIKVKDHGNLAITYYNLGVLYRAQEKFKNATICYDSAMYHFNLASPEGDLGEDIIKNKQLNIESQKRYNQRTLLGGSIILVLLFALFFLYRYNTAKIENIGLRESKLKAQEELNNINAELLKAREDAVNEREQKIKLKEELNQTRERELNHQQEILNQKNILHSAIKNTLFTLKAHLINSSDLNRNVLLEIIEDGISMPEQKEKEIPLLRFIKNMWQCAKNYAFMEDIDFSYDIDGYEKDNTPGDVYLKLKEIIKLAFANIRNHAQCTKASLSFQIINSSFVIIITDNGIGFDKDKIRSGAIGIKDIEQQANDLSGECHIDSIIGKGTSIRVKIPFPFITTKNQI